jgi:hypothetical protein
MDISNCSPKMNQVQTPNSFVSPGVRNISPGPIVTSGLEKFTKLLVHESGGCDWISKEIFQKHVVPLSQLGAEYLWDFFKEYSAETGTGSHDVISDGRFLRSADKIYAQITDKEQVHFYVKIFGKGKEFVQRKAFYDFLQCAYELSRPADGAGNAADDLENGAEWFESVTKSCFHVKEEMSVFFLSNWILNNLQRALIQMHKYLVHRLTTGYQPTKPSEDITDLKVRTIPTPAVNPVLLWLLTSSLPDKYLEGLRPKSEQPGDVQQILANTRQLLDMVKKPDTESWSLLYNSDEHGTSINRFQFHVYDYRGPSLMFITADNGYKICIGSDTEWKESCHFWGGEDSIVIQLQPEFRIVERGEKMLYSNFSIRGYPFGIQAGKNARDVSVDIKPDFQLISFRKIPCKLEKLLVYGCAPPKAKVSQAEQRKWEAKECQKLKKINLNSAEWNDNPDKYLLELGGNYKSYGNN